MIYIKRKVEGKIKKYLASREILAIVGPRQGGKTTLLKKIQSEIKNSLFLSFEDRDELELFEEDIKSFAEKYFSHKYIFIDEFQYSKHGGKQLKYLYDTFPKNKIIISGSSSIDLTIHALRYLTGRVFIFNLYQFDFEEFLQYKDHQLLKSYQSITKKINWQKGEIDFISVSRPINNQLKKALQEFIIWGGYPRVVLAKDKEEKTTILKNIYNTYFLRDIRDTLGLIDDFKLSKLIKALALQIGQIVEYNELGNTTGYDHLTLKKYLNILEKTFICQMIKPYYVNKRTEIAKNPKVYFLDTGLRNFIINDFRGLNLRTDKGSLYENFIFSQLNKKDIPLNYWRTKTQSEVDFIIEATHKKIPLEIKSALASPQISRSLNSFINRYHSSPVLVLNENIIKKTKVDNITTLFLPIWII